MILTGSISNPDGSIIRIDAEGDSYDEARENLYALLEDGQKLLAIRTNS